MRSRRALVIVVALTALLGPLVAATPALAAGGTLGLNAQLVLVDSTGTPTGTPASTLDVPTGRTAAWNIDYQCSGNSCDGTSITATVPASLGSPVPSYSTAHVQGYTRSGSTYTFQMVASLAPGTTGRITFSFPSAEWTTPNGGTYSLTSNFADNAGTSVAAPTSTFTHRAANNTSTVGSASGGGLDSSTTYTLQRCIARTSNAAEGPLGIETGDVMVALLPTGATYLSSTDGGTYSATPSPRVSWTTTSRTLGSTACGFDRKIAVQFNSADGNAVGQAKAVAVTWTGRSIGESSTRTLGTANPSITLTVPAGSGVFDKYPNPASLGPGQSTYLGYKGINTGNADWATVVFGDSVADQFDITSLRVETPGAGAGVLRVTTKNGSDGVAGTSDDAIPFVVASVAANTQAGSGQGAEFAPRTSWPNGHAALGANDYITSYSFTVADVPPGAASNYWILAKAKVLATDRTGAFVNDGQIVGTQGLLTYTLRDGTQGSSPDSGDITVVTPVPNIFTKLTGPGVLPANVRSGTFTYRLEVVNNSYDLRDPVGALLVPEGVTLDTSTIATTSGSIALTGRTVTTIPNWNGGTSTLYRVTFAANAVIPQNSYYEFTVVARLASTAYGNLKVRAYGSSTTVPVALANNFFGTPADPNNSDPDDKDGDGNTTETLGRWDDFIQPARSVSATSKQQIRGSWDSSFATGPAIGYSEPGAADTVQTLVSNDGTVEMDGVSVVTKLSRAGDSGVLGSAGRNPASNTFPIVLASLPSSTLTGVVFSYTTVVDACLPEMNYSPGGCAPAGWSTSAPADLSTVTAVLIDFGANVLKPGRSFAVSMGVTTPTAGATEPDFAVANPTNNSPSTDEISYLSSAFRVKERGTSSYLSPAEAPKVGLRMPGALGPAGVPPTASPLTSTGQGPAAQAVSVVLPRSGILRIADGSGGYGTTRTVAGVGTYTVSGSQIVFQPVRGYQGTPSALGYRVTDGFGQTATSTYTPTVVPPGAPVSVPLGISVPESAGGARISVATPAGGSVRLLDGTTPVTTLVVPGEGTYTVDPATSEIVFTPVSGFTGTATPVNYVAIDAYNQRSTAAPVNVTVVPPTQPGPQSSSGSVNTAQRIQVTPPSGVTFQLVDAAGAAVSSLAIPGQGSYTYDAGASSIVFTPLADWIGSPTPARFAFTDGYGQTGYSTYQPTVLPPAGPLAVPLTGPGAAGTTAQTVDVPLPSGGRVRLLDPSGNEATRVVSPGVGVWALDPATGRVVFTPELGYTGTTPAVAYRIADRWGQSSDSTIVTTVTTPILAPPSVETRGQSGQAQRTSVAVPPGGSVRLVAPDGSRSNRVEIPGRGVWALESLTGILVFTPAPGFVGTASLDYEATDAYGQTAQAAIRSTVEGSAAGLLGSTGFAGGLGAMAAAGLLAIGAATMCARRWSLLRHASASE